MSRTLRSALNESNPNKVADGLHAVLAGDALAASPAFVSGTVSANLLSLPNAQKALAVLFCFARAGGVTGQLAPISTGTTPAAGQVGISPTGNIEFAAADAITAVDVVYLPAQGEVVTETLPVVANVATPAQSKRALVLLSATALVGGSTGAKTVDFRGAAAAAGEAAVTATGTIAFAGADAVTSAEVTYIAAPGVGVAQDGLADLLAGSVDF